MPSAEHDATLAASLERAAAVLRCPQCTEPLRLDAEGRCGGCGRAALGADGVVDLVRDPARDAEREFYEAEWARSAAEPVGLDELERIWAHPGKPVLGALGRSIGELSGKRVLVVGNGDSPNELVLLRRGAELLIVSDLASAGPATIGRRGVLSSEQRSRLCLAAIDALDMPLADRSVDLVYAREAVHHLPDRERFLAEVVRVLRPGGRALFSDPAYSSAWQATKRTVLKPVFDWSHRRSPRSPEDVRETREGGFREAEIAATVRALGAEPFFERHGLVYYLWRRASLLVFPARLEPLGELPAIARPLLALDRLLLRIPVLRAQAMRMVWGLRVPE